MVYGKGQDRESARLALLEAVNQDLMGTELSTNLAYLKFVLQHKAFIEGPATDSSIAVNAEYLASMQHHHNQEQNYAMHT